MRQVIPFMIALLFSLSMASINMRGQIIDKDSIKELSSLYQYTVNDIKLQGVIESLIELNANAGMYDAATALVNNDVNEEADVIDYIVTLSEIIEGGNILVSLSERSLGRIAAEDVKHPINGEIIVNKKPP